MKVGDRVKLVDGDDLRGVVVGELEDGQFLIRHDDDDAHPNTIDGYFDWQLEVVDGTEDSTQSG